MPVPLLVRNNATGPTIYDPRLPGKKPYVWQPAGAPNDADILEVPQDLLDDPDFRATKDRGILQILNSEVGEIQERLGAPAHMRAQYRDIPRSEVDGQDVEGLLTRRQQRDIVAQDCVGPGPAGRDIPCGASVMRPKSEAKDAPPLCNAHKPLANEYALVTNGGSLGDPHNPLVETWRRISMSAGR